MKILIVENNPSVAETLQILLSSYHYAVDVTTTGESGLEMADTFDYDLVLLDICLPELDGIGICQQLRAKGFKMPILLLTAQGSAQQKVAALNTGADDYMIKPFDSQELIARVQALLRRSSTQTQPLLTWGDLSVNPR
ncbi:MAG: response regulator transcription factor, partial [Leptolyngbya sp. SIO1D8]|nr:response regulator transcription factor [Leptolyngbya sp. SIO1D8]